jgi:hypothetical protein
MEGIAQAPRHIGIETTYPAEPPSSRKTGSLAPSPASRWELLVEPTRVFSHPREVLAAADLSREEKRVILASWASDARAIESAPALRQCPGLLGRHVPLDDVLEALRALDPEPPERKLASGKRGRPFGRVRWLTPRSARSGARLRSGQKNFGESHEPA